MKFEWSDTEQICLYLNEKANEIQTNIDLISKIKRNKVHHNNNLVKSVLVLI